MAPSTTIMSDRVDSRSPSSSCPRGHWRPGEDEKLRQLVEKHGPQNWNFIAEKLEGRSGKSCRLRWFNQLDPRINRRPFTAAEEERLLQAHRAHGNRWALISRLFPGRTDNAVKNHWHVVMARRRRSHHRSGGTHHDASGRSAPPRCPPFQYFHFGAPSAAAKTTAGSLCFAMPSSGPSSLGSSGAISVRNFNVPTTVAFSFSREVATAPNSHRDGMGNRDDDHGRNDDEEDGGGAAAAKRKDVPFFDFLGVGI